jgi:molybdopterin molybdotransferase
LWFGVKRDGDRQVLVFGLPGNPVSSFVCFELFVRPAIAAVSGRGFTALPVVTARLSHAVDHAGGRAAYLPAVVRRGEAALDDHVALRFGADQVSPHPAEYRASILPWQGSADLATLARANGLARFSAEKQQLTAGVSVEVLLI